jgi:phytoene dehydrogenase-like protein
VTLQLPSLLTMDHSARAGEDLPLHTYFLDSELCGGNGWPTLVIPSVADANLAPKGHHTLHATMTEPYGPWAELSRASEEYQRRKAQRAEQLMELIRQIIPDMDDRVHTQFCGSPISHARFLTRHRGAYGPKNLLTLTGMMPTAVQPLPNLLCCGDSVFPGCGTPAVSANGMWAANSLVSVSEHSNLMSAIGL